MHPETSHNAKRRIIHLVTALTKYTEARPTRGTFRPFSLWCIGLHRLSEPSSLTFGVTSPRIGDVSNNLFPTFYSYFLEKSISWQLTQFNPSIDWVLGCIIFCQSSQPETKTSPSVKTLSSAPTPSLLNPVPDSEMPLLPVNQKPLQVTLINVSVFTCTCKLKDTQCFQLRISVPETTGHSVTTSTLVNLSTLPEEYHNLADVFSKLKAGKLADHWPYNLKITLDEGTVLPFGPIYSLVSGGTCRSPQVHWWKPCHRVNPSLTLPLWSSGPLHLEERWFSSTLCQFLRPQPDLKEGLLPPSAHFQSARHTMKIMSLYQNCPLAHIPLGSHYSRRQMEDCLPDSWWILWVVGNARRPY